MSAVRMPLPGHFMLVEGYRMATWPVVTRTAVIRHLNNTIDVVVRRVQEKAQLFFNSEIRSGGNGTASPFMKLMLPEIKLASLVERAFSSSIGNSYNLIAKEIASHFHGQAEAPRALTGTIPENVAGVIDDLVGQYTGRKKPPPDTVRDRARIDKAFAKPSKAKVQTKVKSDLYIQDKAGIDYYIEIKTPMPNYDTCERMKRRMFRTYALRHSHRATVRTLVAFPFNPNGVQGTYAWPPARYWFDPTVDWFVGGEQLMGAGFWSFVGGSSDTYQQLLNCCEEVYRHRNSDVMALTTSVEA